MDRKRIPMLIGRVIMHEPGISVNELINRTEISKKNINKALDGMKERGLIKTENEGIYPTDKIKEMKNRMAGRRPGGAGRKHMRMH